MARDTFEKELATLENSLLDLGNIVDLSIVEAVEILRKQDVAAAKRLIIGDAEINRRRFAIEADTLVLIARQQPMARDLRTLAAVLEIATELERIADYSKGNARIAVKLGTKPPLKPLVDIPRMARRGSEMLRNALMSYTRRDVQMARAIAAQDCEIDALYDQIYRELMTYVISDPRNIEDASQLMWCAHNLERTADRVVNICERVVFTVTGDMIELDDPDDCLDGDEPT
ncbi:MAG: phosphate signaling complex protein PhoU [Desulfobacteraceae bacterium]|nr:phosphate signaling complex protein PhoU [Desulfobacteraceae bacterium]